MLIALLAVLVLLKNSLKIFYNRGSVSTDTTKDLSPNPELIAIKSNEVSRQLDSKRTTKTKKQSLFINMSNFLGQQSTPTSVNDTVAPEGSSAIAGSTANSVIVFKVGDKQCCHEICDRNVKVIGSAGNHDHGSSKVKLKNIVDYKWEIKNYPGHLIAVHIDGNHIAYVINVNSKLSRMEGMVRVVNAQSGSRALIKGMSGEVLDLQFAHIEKEYILASIDLNSLYVHRIDLVENNLICKLMVKIEDPMANYTPKYDKISWCPYMECPGDDDEDSSQLVVWARGSIFQCFNINAIINEHGVGHYSPDIINSGYLKFVDESLVITWVALSPDGTTLGVGSLDGIIRFYQVYFHEKEPRCLHQWKPHNGKPVSSFFFLDNLTKNSADNYWKYAITGASNNTEFKVWDCGTWECLQTLTITTANEDKKLHFIADIDRTSSYMVISNADTRTCYVLQIVNMHNTVASSDTESIAKDTSSSSIASTGSAGTSNKLKRSSKARVFIKSISEFPLSSGILSFSIVYAAVRRYKCSNDNYLCDELDDYDEETNSLYCVVVRMFIVQSKSMQDCRILYQPTVSENTDVKSTISNDSTNASKDSSLLGAIGDSDGATGISKDLNINSNTDICVEDDIDDEDEADEDFVDEDEDEDEGVSMQSVKKEKPESNTLDILLGISTSEVKTTTCSSSVLSVTATEVATSSAGTVVKTDSRNTSPKVGNSSGYGQVNLMTPDAFSSTASDKKTPECVSSEVLNTILMLASVTGSSASATKPDNINLLNLVNNKVIEDQEHQKLHLKQSLDLQKKFIAIDSNPGRNVGDNIASGGSSPSREVQEIMSLQEYEKSSYSGDELLQEQPPDTIPDPAETPLDVSADDLETSANKSQTATSWPKVPDVPKVTKHSAELQNAANLISQAVSASTAANINNSHGAPTLVSSNSSGGSINNIVGSSNSAHVDMDDMNMKINKVLDIVRMQSQQIKSMHFQIASMRKQNPFTEQFISQMNVLMDKHLQRYDLEYKRMIKEYKIKADMISSNYEAMRITFIEMINQLMNAQKVDSSMHKEYMLLVASKLEDMKQQIQKDFAQKFTASDTMLKENIAQVCKSKNIIDTFGKSVLVGVQGSLQAAFIESMSSTLIPAYEKSSQNMFKQLHQAFSGGIKEFMEQFDNYLQHLQPMQDSTEEILNKFSGFREHLDSILIQHRNTVTETMLETRKDIKNLELALSRQIQETIRTEVRKSFESQMVPLRSQTNTPAQNYDLKDTIKHLLHQGHINKAFHQALLANDLTLVEFTLKSTDHNSVFNPNCCLEQKVLLSLIQQISADMSNHNEIKQNYLAEAILAIDPSDPITREHAPKVLQELFRNCQVFLINHPKSAQCSNVRMLMKAVQAYKDQF